MGNVNSQFIIFTIIILLGYFIKRIKLISEEEGGILVKLLFNITIPATIFNTLSTSRFELHMAFLTAISFGYGIFMSVLGIYLFRHEKGKDRGVLSMLLPGFNGLIAFSFVQVVLGNEGMRYVAMFDLGVTFTIFLIVEVIANYFSDENNNIFNIKRNLRQLLRSMPLMAATLALIAAIFELPVPFIITNTCSILSKANTPLTLLVFGIYLNFNLESCYRRNIVRVLSLRYIIGLVIGLIIYYTLPFEPLFKEIIMIYLVLPPAFIALAFALKYEYDVKFVGALLNIANVISYPLLWMVFKLFE